MTKSARRATGNGGDLAKAYLLRGGEAAHRCDWDDAVANYRQVVALAPADRMLRYWGHNNLAYSLLLLGRFGEAESHARAAIDVNEDRHSAHKNLGLACEGLGRPIDAATSFLDAAFRCAADERAWLHLQKLLTKHPDLIVEEDELAERIDVLRQLYEANGGVPALH